MPFSKKIFVKKPLTAILLLLSFLALLPSHSARASVGLLYFRAVAGSNFIRLEWETAQELDNIGFKLYRGLTDDFNAAQQINNGIIPAQGGATGAYYEWIDNNVQVGTEYYYWLQDIDTSSNTTEHGPITAAATGGNTIPTVPPPGGGNNTPTPTNTPTRTPTPTVQSGSTAAPTQTPTRTPAPQSTLPNPTVTTAPQVQPTSVSNNPGSPSTAISQSATTTAPEIETEEMTGTTPNDADLTPEPEATTDDPKTTATPQTLVQAASATEQEQDNTNGGLTAQQIGQGGQESQETETTSPSDTAEGLNRSTLVGMALVASVVLLLAGGGGIIMLLLNRTKTEDLSE